MNDWQLKRKIIEWDMANRDYVRFKNDYLVFQLGCPHERIYIRVSDVIGSWKFNYLIIRALQNGYGIKDYEEGMFVCPSCFEPVEGIKLCDECRLLPSDETEDAVEYIRKQNERAKVVIGRVLIDDEIIRCSSEYTFEWYIFDLKTHIGEKDLSILYKYGVYDLDYIEVNEKRTAGMVELRSVEPKPRIVVSREEFERMYEKIMAEDPDYVRLTVGQYRHGALFVQPFRKDEIPILEEHTGFAIAEAVPSFLTEEKEGDRNEKDERGKRHKSFGVL